MSAIPGGKRGRGSATLRILRLIAYLETMSAPARLVWLAERFGVSTRTIRRDLELIKQLGAVVVVEGDYGARQPSARVTAFSWADARRRIA